MNADQEYHARQLDRITGSEDDSLRVKITGSAGSTRWLGITPDQLSAIYRALTEDDAPDCTCGNERDPHCRYVPAFGRVDIGTLSP